MITKKAYSRRVVVAGMAAVAGGLALPSIARASGKTVRLGYVFPIDHPVNKGAEKAASALAEASNGEFKIELFPSAQLGGSKDLVQQVSDGSLDIVIDGPGMIGNWHRPISVLEAPFIPRDWAQLKRIIEGEWAQSQFDEMAGKSAIRVFGQPWYYGARHLTTKDREVHKLADAKGLKIRVPEIPVFLDMIKAIGATPTPMALPEVYLGLKTGVADGQENPLATIYAQKFQEVQGVLNLSAHITSPMLICMNEGTWSGLGDDGRKAFADAFNEGGVLATNTMNELESSLLKSLGDAGMKIVNTDRAEFQAAMGPVYQKNASVWGEGVVEQLQAL